MRFRIPGSPADSLVLACGNLDKYCSHLWVSGASSAKIEGLLEGHLGTVKLYLL